MINNKWAPQPKKQWWQIAAAAGASLLGNAMSNKQSEKNVEMSYENQRALRQTAYQDTTQDMMKAGLNPMMAYQNAATPAPQVPVAQNKSITEGLSNSAVAAMGMQNMEAQNKLLEAQAEKTLAEAQAIPTSTANVEAQTRQIEANLPKIEQEVKNLKLQARTEEERVILTRAQKFLAETQEKLAAGQLTNVEAQTRTQNVLTDLRRLEIPGAKNIAQWEESLGQYSKEAGAAGTAAKVLGGLTNSARKALGK